jgi:uncharacterized Ntn-hydrolase superfamily protein
MALTTDDEVIRIMAEHAYEAANPWAERPWAALKAGDKRRWLVTQEGVLRALRAAGFEIGRPGDIYGEDG